MIPEEPCASAAVGAFYLEHSSVRAMQHVEGPGLDPRNADGLEGLEVRLAEGGLLQDEVAVLDLDVLDVIFRVQADTRIV